MLWVAIMPVCMEYKSEHDNSYSIDHHNVLASWSCEIFGWQSKLGKYRGLLEEYFQKEMKFISNMFSRDSRMMACFLCNYCAHVLIMTLWPRGHYTSPCHWIEYFCTKVEESGRSHCRAHVIYDSIGTSCYVFSIRGPLMRSTTPYSQYKHKRYDEIKLQYNVHKVIEMCKINVMNAHKFFENGSCTRNHFYAHLSS